MFFLRFILSLSCVCSSFIAFSPLSVLVFFFVMKRTMSSKILIS
ncbi:Polygalacturonate 4-alpha-galacturonosyltransferase [Zea mays]|uniref:Polygalacturonate 4-alpha-galacturonosyltransferase n=1 Tax=Zea mays TaxID=4577 RepID=A0A1D6GK90_MAIZE|nr:Polygalacturonate 4-alpha-galacturonosyltransferase [Zea mays]